MAPIRVPAVSFMPSAAAAAINPPPTAATAALRRRRFFTPTGQSSVSTVPSSRRKMRTHIFPSFATSSASASSRDRDDRL